MHFQAMELKICEGCGNLWVRRAAGLDVYCKRCASKFAHYPLAGADRRAGRKRKPLYAIQGGVQ
jgi:predicted amidophosphoribosyltransferase